jgi:hypothetical protein
MALLAVISVFAEREKVIVIAGVPCGGQAIATISQMTRRIKLRMVALKMEMIQIKFAVLMVIVIIMIILVILHVAVMMATMEPFARIEFQGAFLTMLL